MSTRQRPYFIWDYDLTEDDVRVILRSQNQTDKVWMLSRILEARGLRTYGNILPCLK